MGSPVSPIVAKLYMEEVEERALNSFTGTTPSQLLRYVVDTWVKIKSQELDAFIQQINTVEKNIKFIREDTKDPKVSLEIKGKRQTLLSDSHLGSFDFHLNSHDA